jgi:hypothetical protein
MDVIITLLFVVLVALLPVLSSICFASVALAMFCSHQIKMSRWIVIPFFLIAFALLCFFVAALTMTYSPETKPGLLNPILVILSLEGVCLFPLALITLVRGFVALRGSKVEATIDFATVILYGLLSLPYISLHDYYPHV